jgi:protein-disulfide isomerase
MIAASTVLVWAVLSNRGAQSSAQPRIPSTARRTPNKSLPVNPVPLDGAPLEGKSTARIGVIEYSDFECPFCARFVTSTYPAIAKSYVETGRVQFAFRHLPLEDKHASALRAAEAAECSRRQNQFWPMHNALFTVPKALDTDSLFAKAHTIGLDSRRFRQCMNGEATARVRQDVAEARALGINGTPTFLFGTVEPKGLLKVVRRESGAIPTDAFSGILEELLHSVATSTP